MKSTNLQTHCMWMDSDVHDCIKVDKIDEPAERVNIGGYVPPVQGTRDEMERLKTKIQRKPWLRDHIIRQFRAQKNKIKKT
jgi:hypothetical protein